MEKLLDALKRIGEARAASFASFVYTAKESGETAKYLVNLNAKTENLYRRDLVKLVEIAKSLPKADKLHRDACAKVILSRRKSLREGIGQREDYTCRDTYESIEGLPGVKVHKETGVLYVMGLRVAREVIVPGVHKVVKSKPETLARKAIERQIGSESIRQFILKGITTARLAGEEIHLS